MRSHDRLSNFDANVLASVETIRRIGWRLLRDRRELDDFTQEVLVRVYANRAQLREMRQFVPWVSVIARNTARNWNARLRPELPGILPEVLSVESSADARMERQERWKKLLDALNALDPADRELLLSRYVEEASYAELQRRYALSYTALGSRLTRARQQIRRRLESMLGVLLLVFGVSARRAVGGVLSMKLSHAALGTAILATVAIVAGVEVSIRRDRQTTETASVQESVEDSQGWEASEYDGSPLTFLSGGSEAVAKKSGAEAAVNKAKMQASPIEAMPERPADAVILSDDGTSPRLTSKTGESKPVTDTFVSAPGFAPPEAGVLVLDGVVLSDGAFTFGTSAGGSGSVQVEFRAGGGPPPEGDTVAPAPR